MHITSPHRALWTSSACTIPKYCQSTNQLNTQFTWSLAATYNMGSSTTYPNLNWNYLQPALKPSYAIVSSSDPYHRPKCWKPIQYNWKLTKEIMCQWWEKTVLQKTTESRKRAIIEIMRIGLSNANMPSSLEMDDNKSSWLLPYKWGYMGIYATKYTKHWQQSTRLAIECSNGVIQTSSGTLPSTTVHMSANSIQSAEWQRF